MRMLGVKSVKVTNARGFCLEISTAITVVTASRFGKHGFPGFGCYSSQDQDCQSGFMALAGYVCLKHIQLVYPAAISGGRRVADLFAPVLKDLLVVSCYWRHAGLPVSTTQVLCGAIMGIGLFEGKGGVNWRTALKVSLPTPGYVCFFIPT